MSSRKTSALMLRYKETGFEGMTPHEKLSLMLIFSGKNEDEADGLATFLLKTYGSIYNIIMTNPKRLAKQPEIGTATAVYLSLFRNIEASRVRHNNDKTRVLSKTETIKKYAENLLKLEPVENFLVITLNEKNRIISSEILFKGIVNSINIEPRSIIELVLDDASYKVIIAHNHPNGTSSPSRKDIEITEAIQEILNRFNAELIDHIIVGSGETLSMKYDTDYVEFKEIS